MGEDDLNITSLLDMLGKLTGQRKQRGKRHGLVFLLACAVIAVWPVRATFAR